jgi:hypothetical protein
LPFEKFRIFCLQFLGRLFTLAKNYRACAKKNLSGALNQNKKTESRLHMKNKNKYNVAARAGLLALALTAAFALNTTAIAQAPPGSLWYNGDFNSINGLSNQDGGQVAQASVYDNFTGPASGSWNVSALFSDNLLAPGLNNLITGANWEIRTGVASGVPGNLIASGLNAPVTLTPTGRVGFGYTEYQVEVSGLSLSLPHLASGFYWLNVTPVPAAGSSGQSFNSTTSGTNCVGTPCAGDSNSFWNSSSFGVFFGPASDNGIAPPADFSMGVIGTVPEPATVALLTCGVGALLIAVRRRRRAS